MLARARSVSAPGRNLWCLSSCEIAARSCARARTRARAAVHLQHLLAVLAAQAFALKRSLQQLEVKDVVTITRHEPVFSEVRRGGKVVAIESLLPARGDGGITPLRGPGSGRGGPAPEPPRHQPPTSLYNSGKLPGLYPRVSSFMRTLTLSCTSAPSGIVRCIGRHRRHRPVLEL